MFFKKTQISKKSGITFIEMIMVIVIIGILSVATVNRLQSSFSIKVELAAKRVISDLRYAQNLATSEHEEVYIEFFVDNDTYEMYKIEGTTKVYYKNPHTKGSFIVDFVNDSQFGGIDIVSVDFDGDSILRFSSLGKPRNNSGLDLLSTGQISFLYNNAPSVLTVTPGTGFCQSQ